MSCQESSIQVSSSCTTFSGPDATELIRAVMLRSALGLLAHGIVPTRGLSMTKALKMCERYTGKFYKRTQYAQARQDLTVWIETMKSALPLEVQS
jgi:hypothetical protein